VPALNEDAVASPSVVPASPVPGRAFAAFRIGFGVLQLAVLLPLWPHAPELFSEAGLPGRLVGDPGWLGKANPLRALPTPAMAQAVVGAMALCAAAVATGSLRRTAALGLWIGWVWLHDRNAAIVNPSLAYVGWLCLALAVAPPGEPGRPLARTPDRPGWALPLPLFRVAWILLACGYTISGIDKLGSPSWQDGSAIRHVLDLPYARDTALRSAIQGAPWLTEVLSRTALATELLFAPLALFRLTRPLVWLAAVGMHGAILVLLDFAPLTLGMLAIHAFTFDARWLSRWR